MKTIPPYIHLIATFGLILISTPSFSESPAEFFSNNDDNYQNVLVEKVLSVDTILIQGEKRIRLIGLKAPASFKPKQIIDRDQNGFVIEEKVEPTTPIEEQSYQFVRQLLEGKKVRLEFDAERVDTDHKTLAYVFLVKDDLFVNAEIIRQGFANLQISPPNTKHEKELRAAYKEASQEQRGLQSK